MITTDTNTRAQTVSDANSSTYDYLLTHYGPLLTLKQLARVLHTTPSGLRVAMARHRDGMANGLCSARRQFGRRAYFEARRVADLIDDDGAHDARRVHECAPLSAHSARSLNR